jgi:hypothetical protein
MNPKTTPNGPLTAPARELGVANRELRTIIGIDDASRIGLKMDDGREVEIYPATHPHLDHGYAVTSPLQPGAGGRARINPCGYGAGSERPAQQPHGLCRRLAWGARYTTLTYDCEKLSAAPGHAVSHQSVHVPRIAPVQSIQLKIEPMHEHSYAPGIGL